MKSGQPSAFSRDFIPKPDANRRSFDHTPRMLHAGVCERGREREEGTEGRKVGGGRGREGSRERASKRQRDRETERQTETETERARFIISERA